MKKRVQGKSRKLSEDTRMNYARTLYYTFGFSFAFIILAIWIQISGQSGLNGCSYLDPIIIDVLALLASLFLIIEGFARISEHKSASLKRQSTRILRICAGFSILTLHIMQFVHK